MASGALLHDRLETGLSRVLHASLVGPGAGALLLVAIVFINDANIRYSDLHTYSLDGQIVMRLFVCAACGLYGLAHFSRTHDTLLRFPGVWSVLFGAWATFTLLFAVQKLFAIAACLALWCMVFFIPAVLIQLGGRRTTVLVAVTLTVYMVVSWFLYFAFPYLGRTPYTMPDLSIVYRMGGLGHANSTGRLASLGIAMVLALGFARMARWNRLVPLIGFLAITLYATNSRTAILATAALAVVCVRYVPLKWSIAAGFLMLVAAGGFLLVASSGSEELASALSRSGQSEELSSLTGRTEIWAWVLDRIEERPIVGQGYGCARFAMAVFNDLVEQDMAGYHAHNTLLNLALTTGVVGAVLFLGMIFNLALDFVRQPSIVPDMILVLVVVAGIADAVAFSPIPDVYTVLWLIALFWRQTGMTLEDDSAPVLETAG